MRRTRRMQRPVINHIYYPPVHPVAPVQTMPEPADTESLIRALAAEIVSCLREQKPESDSNEMMTVDEAYNNFFKRKLSKTKLYELLRTGEIKASRAGAKYMIRREVLEKWMANQEQEAMS